MIGIIGLGRMGQSIALRLLCAGFEVIGYAPSQPPQELLQYPTFIFAKTLEEVAQCADVCWVMVPAGQATKQVIIDIARAMKPGGVIIDGGNSFYKDSLERAKELEPFGIEFIDCGTSGGLHGREVGFSLMIGGSDVAFKKCEPFFKAIAAPEGYAHVGPTGAGHYVKMVHNGIEYGLLQAYAEGFDVLKHGAYPELDLEQISAVWLHGSIIRSWILQLAHEIFTRGTDFEHISGVIQENGTGRWTLEEAQARGVSTQLIEKALAIRAESRNSGGNYGTKLVALLRHEFGGHPVQPKG